MSFSYFLRRLLQTFRLHNSEADLKSSALLRMAKDNLNATMIMRWNQHKRIQALLQPNITHFADWIDSYAEAARTTPNNGTKEPERTILLMGVNARVRSTLLTKPQPWLMSRILVKFRACPTGLRAKVQSLP